MVGHKCSRAQLLILESETNSIDAIYEEVTEEVQRSIETGETVYPKITLYALTG